VSPACLEHIAGIDLGEAVGVYTQDLLFAAIGNLSGQAQLALFIKYPISDLLGVLRQQRLLTG